MGGPQGGFTVDEEPLRQWVLKAYQERRDRDLESHQRAEGLAAEVVRTPWLLRPNLGDIMCGDIFDPCEGLATAVEPLRLQRVERLIRTEVACQLAIT